MSKYILLLVAMLSTRFAVKNPPDTKSIRCFRFTFAVPMIDSTGKFLGTHPMIDERTFVCGDLIMFETVTEGMEHYPPDSDRYFKWYNYLVFEQDSAVGMQYEGRYPDSVRRCRMDSVLLSRRGNEGLPMQMLGKTPHLVSSTIDRGTGIRVETYTQLGDSVKRDEDSCILFFNDRLKILPGIVALSPTLDSIRGSRLFEVKFKFGSFYSKERKVTIDPYSFSWKMEEQAFFNRDSALLYFNRYLRDCKVRH